MTQVDDARAMELFEKATEKELHGLMSDAVRLYRAAFKINDQIDLLYRQQKVPKALQKLKQEHGKNVSTRLDEEKLRHINVDRLLLSFENEEAKSPDPTNPDHYDESHMAIKFANLGFADHPISVPSVSPLVHLPSEVWHRILDILLTTQPEAWFRFGITCKRNAYLAFGTEMWRALCYKIYPRQVYEENQLVGNGNGNGNGLSLNGQVVPSDPLEVLPLYLSWKNMLQTRPFAKFLGCYISVVNYYSEGAREEFSLSWTNPVRTVTYYRYLRLYPDGTCVMALTTLEPAKVVSQLLRKNTNRCILPENTTTDNAAKEPHRIFHGKWTISTEAHVHIEVNEGSVPYYSFHYRFLVRSLGNAHHSKLAWMSYYAVRKRMSDDDDREGEVVDFALKNETAFKFLRVRSYDLTN